MLSEMDIPNDATPFIPETEAPVFVYKSDLIYNYSKNTNLEEKKSKMDSPDVEDCAKESDCDEKFSLSKISTSSKCTLLLLALANFFSGCALSVIAPFFPQESAKKDISTTMTGVVFSVFELGIFLSSPFYGNYLTRIGAEFIFLSGIFVAGCSVIIFGVLDKCPPGTPFITMALLCRLVESVGFSAYVTAGFAIISHKFPKHVATVFGLLEMCAAMGLMLGPAIGGGLYELGGYGLPFFVTGGLIVLNGIFICSFLPRNGDFSLTRTKSPFTLAKSPIILITCLVVIVGTASLGFFQPTLSKHVQKFGLTSAQIGLMFVIAPALSAVSSPLWGYISDAKNIQSPLMIGGNLVCGLAFLLAGSSPLLPFLPDELWQVVVGLVMYGACISCAVVPAMKCLLVGALEVGFEDNLDTYGLVSGLFQLLFAFGGFVGPAGGGFMMETLGFAWACTVMALVDFSVMVICLIFFLIRRLRHKKKSSYEKVEEKSGPRRKSVLFTSSYVLRQEHQRSKSLLM